MQGKMGSRSRAAFAVGAAAWLGACALVSASASAVPSAARTARSRAFTGDLVYRHIVEDLQPTGERPSAPAAPLPVRSTAPSAIGAWGAPTRDASKVIGIHAVLMRSGKVLMWSPVNVPSGSGYEIQTMAEVFDPVTGKSVRNDPPEDAAVFCGGAAILGDGTVLVVGGLDPYHGWSSRGNPTVLLFDPIAEKWTEAKPMAAGRWYPTVTELADGSAIIVGGRDVNAKPNRTIERVGPLPSTDPVVVGQMSLDAQQGLYPNQFLLPNGHVFTFAGNSTNFLDPSTWRIDAGPVPRAPEFDYPNAVVLPLAPGRDIQMVVYGGKDKFAGTTTPISSRIDLSSAGPTFTALTPMPQPRSNMNSVLLPDGTILVVGGNLVDNFTTPYLQSLLYNPATDTWTPMATQALRRAYHSTAILLPDGRVLSAGDNNPGGGQNNEEIYSPPYLFRSSRPQIVQAPSTATVGGTYVVTTSGPVRRAVLMSPAATTHATNMNQRMIQVPSYSLYGHGIVMTIPADGTVPPGPYMLFVLDTNNTPSVASWVMVS